MIIKPYLHHVQYYETDGMKFTHHSNYIRFMEEARSDFLNQIGFPYQEMEKAGFISPNISVSCNYRKSTTYPDTIKIETFVINCGFVKITHSYKMTVNDELVCDGTSEHCFLDQNNHPVNLKRSLPRLYNTLLDLCISTPTSLRLKRSLTISV